MEISMLSTSRFAGLFLAGIVFGAGPAQADGTTVADLAWMTGYWSGPVGDQTMEENWNAPLAGTLASTVRMAGPDGTRMVELVIIHEHEGSLILNLQQFKPDYTPLTPAPQKMKLVGTGERSVTFEDAENTPGIKRLTYSREGDVFTVEAVLPDGNVFKAPLKAR
jgi:hypothetical protein